MGAKTDTYIAPAEPILTLGSTAWSAPQGLEFSAALYRAAVWAFRAAHAAPCAADQGGVVRRR